MRITLGLAVLVIGGAVGLAGGLAGTSKRSEAPQQGSPDTASGKAFVVHEWGTFTNFSAPDGTQLAFRSVIGEELPPFVRKPLWRMLTKGELIAKQRMETPVTYFYTERPRTVEAHVDFPSGSLTEFYPPAESAASNGFADAPNAADSALTWHFDIRPQSDSASSPGLPAVEGDERYGCARQTDSAIVEVTDDGGEKHCEKFLFYRGAGDFSLPVRLEHLSGGRFRAVNDGPESIDGLFMVIIDDSGLHFREYSKLPRHAAVEMQVPETTTTADQLGDRMAAVLTAAGLYEKEARAMIDTWRSSWFREPGARLFYLVPRRLTDEVIPLTVDPAPDEIVRVLVGRMEILMTEVAHRLTDLAKARDAGLLEDEANVVNELHRLGRFANPAIDYLAAISDATDGEIIKQLRTLVRR
ncbi:MAG TPA: hypothetical protein VFI31_18190 [Pirellulales bacterium]|nr:hypothetical protein [Pirellulales bacterium]